MPNLKLMPMTAAIAVALAINSVEAQDVPPISPACEKGLGTCATLNAANGSRGHLDF